VSHVEALPFSRSSDGEEETMRGERDGGTERRRQKKRRKKRKPLRGKDRPKGEGGGSFAKFSFVSYLNSPSPFASLLSLSLSLSFFWLGVL